MLVCQSMDCQQGCLKTCLKSHSSPWHSGIHASCTLSLPICLDADFAEELSLGFAYGTQIGRFLAEAYVAALSAVPHLPLLLVRLSWRRGRRVSWFLSEGRCGNGVRSELLFSGSPFRDWLDRSLSFGYILSHVECAVAVSKLLYVGIAIVARADDVSVEFELA